MNGIIQPPANPMPVQMLRVLPTSHGDAPSVAEFLMGPPMHALHRFPTGHCVMQFVQIGAAHSMHVSRESAWSHLAANFLSSSALSDNSPLRVVSMQLKPIRFQLKQSFRHYMSHQANLDHQIRAWIWVCQRVAFFPADQADLFDLNPLVGWTHVRASVHLIFVRT